MDEGLFGPAINTQEEWRLLNAVYPIFASKSPAQHIDQSESDRHAFENFETVFEFEIWLLPHALQEAHAFSLSKNAFQEGLQVFSSLLGSFERYVDKRALGLGSNHNLNFQLIRDHAYPKLQALKLELERRHRKQSGNMLDHATDLGYLVWVNMNVEGFCVVTEALERFNRTINRLSSNTSSDVSSINVDKTWKEDDIQAAIQAGRFCEEINCLFDKFVESLDGCSRPHAAMVHLTGSQSIEMVLSSCSDKPRWHQTICEVDLNKELLSSDVNSRGTTPLYNLCKILRGPSYKPLHILCNTNEILYYTEQALSRSKIHPNITLLKLLEERVRDRLNARVAPILSKKKKKIAAVNLARSLLTLFGSQWLQKPWNSQEIFFMHDQNTNEIVDLQMPYILSTLTQNNWIESGPESLEYCFLFVFAFGILLLELELDQSIPMIDEDEEEADEDFPAIYMSLLRTFLGRKEDLDDPYLEDVIESCLDIRNKVESIKHPSLSNDLKLRAAFLKYVVQPLTQRLQAVHPEISLDALAVPQQNVGAKLSHTFTNDGQRSPGVPLLKSSTNIPLDQSFSSHQSASTKNPKAPTDWRVPPIRTQTWNPLQPRHRRDFEIAIICALPIEAEMVRAIFDEHWDSNGEIYGKAQGDRNAYSTGRIGRHNIVLAYMPGMGNNSAAIVANNCRFSFEGIKLALVVGICGGVPFRKNGEEIVLGDVVISDGIVPFDFGRQFPNQFIRKNTLLDSPGRPNIEIRSILAMLRVPSHRKTLQDKTTQYLSDINRGLDEEVVYPGVDEDKLYEPNYHHKHQTPSNCEICSISNHEGDQVCESALISSCEQLSCNEMRLVPRSRLSNIRARTGNTKDTGPHQPTINFGLVASGNVVMKSGRDRDNIASQEDVIAFEMEGAGVWDNFPCLIIKGVCDYADSHKNKTWQNYAAATAAACVKAFLESWAVGGSRLPNH